MQIYVIPMCSFLEASQHAEGVRVVTTASPGAPVAMTLSTLSGDEQVTLSTLSGDEQGIILGQLRNALEPRLVMYSSRANKELRALLPPAVQRQLRTDYEEATDLCVKMGMRD